MAEKIALTGLLLSSLLLIPSLLKDFEVPFWAKALIIVPALAGLPMAFIGTLVAIWG